MKAMIYDAFEKAPDIRTLPDPTPGEDAVVIAVGATGLCRSDWHGWMGHDSDIRLPHVPGHELAGKVVANGPRRHALQGRRPRHRAVRLAAAATASNAIPATNRSAPNQFQPGFTHWGSFAEYVAIDYADTNLVHLPDSIDDRDGGKPRLPLRHLVSRRRRPGRAPGRANGSRCMAAAASASRRS